jgi:hypothetical protein
MRKDSILHNRECHFLARVNKGELSLSESATSNVGDTEASAQLDKEICRLVARICLQRLLEKSDVFSDQGGNAGVSADSPALDESLLKPASAFHQLEFKDVEDLMHLRGLPRDMAVMVQVLEFVARSLAQFDQEQGFTEEVPQNLCAH